MAKRVDWEYIKWTHASLWVQILGSPFDMISPRVASEVGSRLGVDTQKTELDDDIVKNTRHTLVVEKCLTAEEVAAEFPSNKGGDKAISLGITVDLMLNDNQGIASVY